MSIQRPWMLADQRECALCAAWWRGGQPTLGPYEHIHLVSKIPRRSVGARRWAREPGWAVGGSGQSFWVFFAAAEAAAVFARSAAQSRDLSNVEIRHAYTESVHTGDPDVPERRFLGIAGPASRCLRNVKMLQAWVDQIVTEERAAAAS